MRINFTVKSVIYFFLFDEKVGRQNIIESNVEALGEVQNKIFNGSNLI